MLCSRIVDLIVNDQKIIDGILDVGVAVALRDNVKFWGIPLITQPPPRRENLDYISNFWGFRRTDCSQYIENAGNFVRLGKIFHHNNVWVIKGIISKFFCASCTSVQTFLRKFSVTYWHNRLFVHDFMESIWSQIFHFLVFAPQMPQAKYRKLFYISYKKILQSFNPTNPNSDKKAAAHV